MIEIFKDIQGYEGLYQISNFGRIKQLPRPIKNKWGTYTIRKEKIMRLNLKRTGYIHISLTKEGNSMSASVHRLVAINFIANPENKFTVNHKNGNKTDNMVENLEWCTSSENVIHSFATGLKIAPHGSSHYRTKLSEQDVSEIKGRHKNGGITMKSLAVEYKICLSAISNIINGKRWCHTVLKTA